MKKLVVVCLSLVLMLPLMFSARVDAVELGDNEIYEDETTRLLDQRIKEVEEKYMRMYGVSDTSYLTFNQSNEMTKEIAAIKEAAFGSGISSKNMAMEPSSRRGRAYGESPLYGNVLITMDASKTGIKHGHVGIGSFKWDATVEANPGDGVKEYTNRISTVWNKFARTHAADGVYAVHGATDAQYRLAVNYALSKVGKRYGFNGFDNNDFYCSELVYLAFKNAGKTIGPLLGTVWPLDIANHVNTYEVIAFPVPEKYFK